MGAGEALDDDLGVLVDENAHVVRILGVCFSPSPAQRERGWGEGAAFRKAPSSALRAPSPAAGRRAGIIPCRERQAAFFAAATAFFAPSLMSSAGVIARPRSEENTVELQ